MSISTKSDRRWSALGLIVTAQFMVILDVAIVNVALPSIKSDLGFSQPNLQWVISAYAILFGGTLLLGGRLADLSLGHCEPRHLASPDRTWRREVERPRWSQEGRDMSTIELTE